MADLRPCSCNVEAAARIVRRRGPVGVPVHDREAVEDRAVGADNHAMRVVPLLHLEADIAAERGGVDIGKALVPRCLRAVEAAVERHPLRELEGDRAVRAGGGIVVPLGNPDLIARRAACQGVLEILIGIGPGRAVVEAVRLPVHVDDAPGPRPPARGEERHHDRQAHDCGHTMTGRGQHGPPPLPRSAQLATRAPRSDADPGARSMAEGDGPAAPTCSPTEDLWPLRPDGPLLPCRPLSSLAPAAPSSQE